MNAHAIKIGTSVLNKFWKDHTSDKYGFRSVMSSHVRGPFAVVSEAFLSFAMTEMDKVVRMEWGKVGGVAPRCVLVDLHQSRSGVMDADVTRLWIWGTD